MKKGMVFVVIGVLILLAAAVVSVGARPDDGLSGGNSRRSSATVWQTSAGEAPAVCLTHGTAGLQARQDRKDLQVELAMNGSGSQQSAPPEFVACAIQNQVSTR